ncbi:uncharacterized protein LOC121393240 [Xenopus laevis]|uniref:Uncharacterized protein LOC121393240 n=1 Tax=Xenopus laevis TaxID=8355 RepID=A0A8J1KID3_XENLA|nr:uncharacterized protein LOC121393240 [Xenopus laevis]
MSLHQLLMMSQCLLLSQLLFSNSSLVHFSVDSERGKMLLSSLTTFTLFFVFILSNGYPITTPKPEPEINANAEFKTFNLETSENTNIKHYPLRILDLICGLLGVISIAFLSTYVWSMLRYKKKEEEDVEMQNNPDVLLEAPGEKQTVILIPGACDLTNIVATDINTEEVEENKVNPVATEEPKDKITEPNEELQQKPEQEAELKEQKKKKKWKCFFFKKKSKQRKDKIKSGKKGREDGNGNDTSLNNTSEAYE